MKNFSRTRVTVKIPAAMNFNILFLMLFFTDAPLPGFVYCRSIFERRRLFAGAGRSKYGRIAGERRSQNGTAPEPKRCFGGPSEVAYRVAEPPAIPALEQEGYCAGIRYGPSGYVFISSAAVRETVAATE